MKKILGVLGVAVIAATMFFSANAVSGSTTDLNLASLISMNTANAEGCDQCKVVTKILGINTTVFSCKTVQGESCSATHNGTTVSCSNAKQC